MAFELVVLTSYAASLCVLCRCHFLQETLPCGFILQWLLTLGFKYEPATSSRIILWDVTYSILTFIYFAFQWFPSLGFNDYPCLGRHGTSHPHGLSCETSRNLFLILHFLSSSSLCHPTSPQFAACDVRRKHKLNSFPVIASHRVWLAPPGALCQKPASRIWIKTRQLQTRIAQAILRGVHRRFVCNKCYRSGGCGLGQRRINHDVSKNLKLLLFVKYNNSEANQDPVREWCFKNESSMQS